MKRGIAVEIPGFGRLALELLATDYTGTLSHGGKLNAATEQRILLLSDLVDIHILTADTLGTAARELGHLPVTIHRLEPAQQDEQKREFLSALDPARVAALGNGNNDRLLLGAVKQAGGLAIAVDNGEGCAVETLLRANLFITGIENALDLLLETGRLKATLRF